MTLISALNIIWAAIGVGALATLSVAEWRRRHSAPMFVARRCLAVLLVMVALFPCVSASDDVFSFSLLQSQMGKHGSLGAPIPEDGKEKPNLQLARMLQVLDHVPLTAGYALLITFCCFAFVPLIERVVRSRAVLCTTSRAPPSILSAA